MNKTAKRIIAGVSAAVMFVSAVGVGTFTNSFMKTSYADSGSKGKNGKSTGFSNLEQDTEGDNYNTGYGLHTNKTARVADGTTDGRTFDVDLESWYVGENPVDVATILDASGSMAWTVDTLDPLEISLTKDVINELQSKYEITSDDLEEFSSYKDETTTLLAAIQKKEDGYLPQDVVDLILNPKNTDNSKLSYSDYMYYIYESRSSVSEFVPLGYWDGGQDLSKPIDDANLIGYYPFENSLANSALSGKEAKYIKHAADNGNIFDETQPTQIIEPPISSGDLIISQMINQGALLSDVNCTESFTISVRVKSEVDGDKSGYDELPLVYIGNMEGTDYIQLQRQKSGAKEIRKVELIDEEATSNMPTSSNKLTESKHVFGKNRWVNLSIVYDADLQTLKLVYSDEETHATASKTSYSFLPSDYKIILGGNVKGGTLKVPDKTWMTDVCVFNKALNNDELEELNSNKKIKTPTDLSFYKNVTAYYNFDDSFDSLVNNVSGNSRLTYIPQPSSGSGFVDTPLISTDPATPTYSTEHKNGEHSLNVTKTSKLGSVLLDAVPKDKSNFTISFAIKKENDDHKKFDNVAEIMYVGDNNLSNNDYYHIARNWKTDTDGINDDRHLRFFDKNESGTNDAAHINSALENTEWCYVTFVVDNDKVYAYKDGKPDTEKYSGDITELKADTIKIIIAGLKDKYNGADIFIDDLYVFDKSLTASEVNIYFGKELCDATTYKENGTIDKAIYHAKSVIDGESMEIAQVTASLHDNPAPDQRCGWYYVNSHSAWADISGCLESGKQYLGIVNDELLGVIPENATKIPTGKSGDTITEPENDITKDNESIATIPSSWVTGHSLIEKEKAGTLTDEERKILYDEMGEEEAMNYYDLYESLVAGNDESKKFEPSENERSIQFYVDIQGYLRCFYCTGDLSWKKSGSTWNYNPRTFCSVVYQKQPYVEQPDGSREGNATKYEQLNYALNQFYTALAQNSDLTNSAIVRYSTNNAANDKNLDMLVMQDWTNWSEFYQENRSTKLEYDDFLHNLLVPEAGETSTNTTTSRAQKIKEYPYVMTGGTYTWTGLKSFYDNMVDTETKNLESGNRVYDIANDARDKYLIIFTDGRDNLVGDESSKKYIHKNETSGDYKNSVGNYAPTNSKGEQRTDLTLDSQLAEAWADKLKDEGYTIYCVMMATGSISQTANKDEYDKAHNFLTTLAGSTEADKELADLTKQLEDEKAKTEPDGKIVDSLQKQIDEFEKYVIVADPSSKGNTTVEAFQQILTQIQQPRDDYTVQDYIDPRFDLVNQSGEVYHLGAGGKITKSDGTEVKTVGNVIKAINEDSDITEEKCKELGLEYIPLKSEMVNRKPSTDTDKYPDGYDNGDGVGTGYIYYDDVKDMYYLRWTDQIIPMENKTFDTSKDGKELDVWSATIRLKAKDDFIGGNDVLTNGNEAGENLVFSEATIQNIDKDENYKLYGFTDDDLKDSKISYRKKLAALSGTNRKINAVDADGVSQAVYGNGIDIPSSGFPRVVVDVRLKPLDAKDLNDVIYMGEVVSPTMMLADLENGYMTGSYYLEYLERYAYRVYGAKADQMPLIELLNQWLKINIKEEAEKTFTIPYIYLPDPKYNNGKLVTTEDDKVVIENSAGLDSGLEEKEAFNDLNLRDVTGFITYTWKREGSQEEQQRMEGTGEGTGIEKKYDITKEYVVKNAEQIKYNLQLKFTPLKDKEEQLKDFKLDEHFITSGSGVGEVGDKFFDIENGEFNDIDVSKWSISGREEYLKAMVSETKTYEPHVMYDESKGKWVLVEKSASATAFSTDKAIKYYIDKDTTKQTSKAAEDNKLTDAGVYDWDSSYKESVGDKQIVGDKLKEYYTNDCKNVALADKAGTIITDADGNFKGENTKEDVYSLVANTTYIKDVVNGALALELVVDGKYLNSSSSVIKKDKTYTFDATRYYDDPIDPLPYGTPTKMNADTGEADTSTGKVEGKNYRLTFTVDESSLPKEAKPDVLYTVWAKLSNVAVEDGSSYTSIEGPATEGKPYLGYAKVDALPIGTYVISVNDSDMSSEPRNQYYIGDDAGPVYFKYLKLDNASTSYTYDKFPADVYGESKSAPTSTGDGEYLIWNGSKDNATKNIADCSRTEDVSTQELTFCFGTNKENNSKGYDRNDAINHGQDYAKDRLGIILLSRDNNALTISKEVTNTDVEDNKTCFWEFTVNFKPEDAVDFASKSEVDLKWYKDDVLTETGYMGTYYPNGAYPEKIKFEDLDGDGTYTATVYLKHNEKVRINGLPEGTWQVKEEENRDLFYSPHNNAHGLGDGEWEYERADATSPNIQLNPASHVDFVNEFPYELPSAGGIGVDQFIFFGTVATVTVALTVIASYYKRRKRRRIN